jgi:pimeloyl-ACP methyl ester carboxylesterase
MPRVQSNRIELEYEERGQGEPLILIMGIGAQLTLWPDGFVDLLAAGGFRVLRFDNRDVGLSSKLDALGTPDLPPMFANALLGRPVAAPYRLEDMAADTVGLMDALGIEKAHVVGVSMGGMIAQTMAIHHGSRLRSLVSMSSSTGSRRHMVSRPSALGALLAPVPPQREKAAERFVKLFRSFSGPGFPFDEAAAWQRGVEGFDRCFHPNGTRRQLAAVLSSGSRLAQLPSIRTPTLIIHGTHDPLFLPFVASDTARAIPGARLLMVEGMGHELPTGAWPQITNAIVHHARTADAAP